ncbi:MAG TPA: hypothetical protein PLO56_14905, partial [Rhodothermales bacterium]|nr:hypothetical protein [Rhodothermales bacterium]
MFLQALKTHTRHLVLLVSLLLAPLAPAQDFWEQSNELSGGFIHALATKPDGTIFAGTWGGGVYSSSNNGSSWTPVNSGLTNTNVRSLALLNANGVLFAGTNGGGVFMSSNNGSSWTPVNNGLTNTYVYSLAINANGVVFAGTDGGVYSSSNNGSSWTPVNNG